MPFELAKEYPRLWSLNFGRVMVVTDLHGDWQAYQLYRDKFIELQTNGKADCLIFTGDLIHSDSEEINDQSAEIVLDVLKMQRSFGEAIIYLCGNHELPHIYGFGLGKGEKEYTSIFEKRMECNNSRAGIVELFMSLPFCVRTPAGISITHAGATPLIGNIQTAIKLFNWDHQEILSEAKAQLAKSDKVGLRRAYAKLSQTETYDELAKQYLAVSGIDDPRHDNLLLGFFATMNDDFGFMRSFLFTKCEQEYGMEEYSVALLNMLQYLSIEYAPQKVLVSGHMVVVNGHQTVAESQLRFASGSHSRPAGTGKYLLLDTTKPIEKVEDLVAELCSIH